MQTVRALGDRRVTLHHTTTLKRILLTGLLVLLSTGPASIASAGNNVWTSKGPEGGIISTLVIDPATPATLYAGTNGGAFAIQLGVKLYLPLVRR